MYKWCKNFRFNVDYQLFNKFANVINLVYDGKIYSVLNSNFLPAPFSLIVPENVFQNLKNSKQKIYNFGIIKGDEFDLLMPINFNSITNKNLLYFENALKLNQVNEVPFDQYFQKWRQNKEYNKLYGLGLGLTPSGDDYLLGQFAACWSRGEIIDKSLKNLIMKNPDKTNVLSWNFLQNAINGYFRLEIIELLKNLDSHNFAYYLDQVLKIGSSSGYFILLGIFDIINL